MPKCVWIAYGSPYNSLLLVVKPANLNPGLHKLAIAQARAHDSIAKDLSRRLTKVSAAPEYLAYLVNASFALELSFKALMIAGRNGEVTRTHELGALYREFPAFLQADMCKRYEAQLKKVDDSILVIALKQSAVPPEKPTRERFDSDYRAFDKAIASVGNCFVRARYFLEEIGSEDYAYIEVPTGPITAMQQAIYETYASYLGGAFKDCAESLRPNGEL